ncbi:hypothetical protein [Aneurinibacillus aneurinilyticus]|uniref:hypothetical protein n=1 Tax=Aneurinibacillus aneurinilyticus TaxID=1391 RepID=UPI0023F14A81|nr:hypothetical protein [Aneurinibacillus aneurinilyticus]
MMSVAVQQPIIDDIRSDIYEAIEEYSHLYYKVEVMPDILKPVWNRVLRQYRENILEMVDEWEGVRKYDESRF